MSRELASSPNRSNLLSKSNLLLIALFLIIFAVPVLLLGPLLSSRFLESEPYQEDIFGGRLVGDPIEISDHGTFIKVNNAQDLAPPQNGDFLIVSWFNLRSLPSKEGRMFLLSHLNEGGPSKKGYGLALSRASREWMRPEVYLSFDGKTGGWYRFSDIRFLPGQWLMFAMAYYEGKYLGAFVGTYDDRGKVNIQKAGGYELDITWKPYKRSALKVGALKGGLFRGQIGPVGVFNLTNLKESLNSILKDLMRDPIELPSQFNDENVLLWAPSGRNDLSPKAHEIVITEASLRAQKRGARSKIK